MFDCAYMLTARDGSTERRFKLRTISEDFNRNRLPVFVHLIHDFGCLVDERLALREIFYHLTIRDPQRRTTPRASHKKAPLLSPRR